MMASALRLSGKVAVVTGGANGIGEASVRRLVADGARVVIVDLDIDSAEALSKELGQQTRSIQVDVGDFVQVEQVVTYTIETFERIDILFNNAGLGVSGTTPEISPDDWQRVMDISLNSVFYSCRVAIPHMAAGGGGCVINTSSISGVRGDYALAAYNAAKAGLINYTRALALDHAQDSIRVNAICPGYIETQMSVPFSQHPAIRDAFQYAIPMGRAGNPEEISGVVSFLASDDASYITGQAIAVDGGLSAGSGIPNIPRIAREARSSAN